MPKLNVSDLLKQAAQKTPVKKGKDEKPEFKIPTLDVHIENLIDAKKRAADAEADQARAEAFILPVAEEHWLRHCQDNRTLVTTVKLAAPGGTVNVTTQNRYSKIATEEKDNLSAIFGNDTDKYFMERTEISLTEAALADEKIVEKLIAAVGAENFSRFFAVKQFLEPTDAYHLARVTDAAVSVKHAQAVDAKLVKPAKAAVKPA